MLRITILSILLIQLTPGIAFSGFLNDLIEKNVPIAKQVLNNQKGNLDETTIIKGLKEALNVGTKNAVKHLSKKNGYFSNESVKILVPEKVQKVTALAKKLGFNQQVDNFELSMNRAAEKAAPKATQYFIQAIRGMSFEDVKKIHKGGNTAATEYLKKKTYDKIYKDFKPEASKAMNKVGVTKAYKSVTKNVPALPLLGSTSINLDDYVTTKGLEGLFTMVAEEEKKIRENPAARVTKLLKTVFGN